MKGEAMENLWLVPVFIFVGVSVVYWAKHLDKLKEALDEIFHNQH